MLREAIFHKPWSPYAYLLDADTLSVTLKARKGDLKSCQLFHGDPWEPEKPLEKIEMPHVAADDLYDYFQAIIKVPTSRRFRYTFYLDDGHTPLWLTEAGFSTTQPTPKELGLPFFEFLYIRENDVFTTPEWARNAVFYQIFPDRFCNGDRTNDPSNTVKWGKPPQTHETFYGGDLQGILDKLEYLNKLGVNAIYLTPIFASPTTHKYDTTDYYKIDPNFSDVATFKKLVQKCRETGIRVILDGVFDHCGYEFWAFQDVVKNGARSKYKDWFRIFSFPIKTHPLPTYETWGRNIWRLPRLRTSNPEVKKYLIDLAAYWIKEADIDGWRLDTATEIDHGFWRDFRKAVKQAKPEAIIIGEVPHDASPWLEGDQLDSVMNYPFRDIVIEFFAKGSIQAEEFDARLTQLRMRYQRQANEVLYNLLGSHDTARFLALCDDRVEKLMCALVFQMTYVGMPAVFYGDEIGMSGRKDEWEDSRRPMVWEEARQNGELLAFYRKLIAIRKTHRALTCGDFTTIQAKSDINVYAYLRRHERERIVVALNNSPQPHTIALKAQKMGLKEDTFVDLLSEGKYEVANGEILLHMKPYGASILE